MPYFKKTIILKTFFCEMSHLSNQVSFKGSICQMSSKLLNLQKKILNLFKLNLHSNFHILRKHNFEVNFFAGNVPYVKRISEMLHMSNVAYKMSQLSNVVSVKCPIFQMS